MVPVHFDLLCWTYLTFTPHKILYEKSKSYTMIFKLSRVKYRRPLAMQTKKLKWQHNEFFWYTVFIIRQCVALVQLSPNGCVCIIVCDTETSTMRRPRSDLYYCAPEKSISTVRYEGWFQRYPSILDRFISWYMQPPVSEVWARYFSIFFNSLKCIITHSMPSSQTNIITYNEFSSVQNI